MIKHEQQRDIELLKMVDEYHYTSYHVEESLNAYLERECIEKQYL